MGAHNTLETLVDVVRQHVAERGSCVAYTFLPNGEGKGLSLSYEQLHARAGALAAQLCGCGAKGKPVLVLCPSGLDYVTALLGCLYAGAIAVPAYPPTRTSLARVLPRTRAIAEDAGAKWALVLPELRELGEGALAAALGSIELLDIDLGTGPARLPPAPNPNEPALLQYTSGSTASPKGVLISHGQLLANLGMAAHANRLASNDVFLSWLPPFHDMGLIGGIFEPLYTGARGVLMPTEAFVRRPKRWLEAAHDQQATILMAPNFAFDLCVKRIEPEKRAGLDLSSVRAVYNGAEPIHAATLDAFGEAFAPHGFRPAAFYPCYGMAEATLIISGGDAAAAPVSCEYLADELERGRAMPLRGEHDAVAAQAVKTRRLVGCGHALLEERIMVVDPSSRQTLASRRVGEVWVQSRSVALGYWNRPEDTERSFRAYTAEGEGPFLRTGDLGFFDQGELFITGRLKDLIILRGLNHYPQDIERTVQSVNEALLADAGAAFCVTSEAHSDESLIVVQEFDKRTGVAPDGLMARIAQAIREEHEIAPAAIVLIKRGSMRKTSSGKVQRRATHEAYLAGELRVIASWALRAGIEVPAPHTSGGALAPSAEQPAPRTHTRPVAQRRESLIADWLRAHLAAKLGCSADEIDPREPLARYGVDSLAAAELTEELEQWLGTELPSTISYDNPTIAELARALAALGGEPQRPRRATPELAVRGPIQDREPIAIVGMACRFPGAPNLKGFWTLLRHGVDAITEVPRERWDARALYDPEPGVRGKICSKWGGFVEHIADFDADFFGISAHEAARMDPQQRMFLEVAWEALEDAGHSPAELAGGRTGVFAGVCSSDYALLYGGDLGLIDADYGTGNAPSVVANRLSYFLDLKGPSEAIDTACSSSLVAVQHACRSLRDLECELAIVGGVNAVLAPEASVYFSQLRALAKDGRCKTFDSRADGFVRSEGVGVILLKPLRRALADGDRIYALVEGCAVNHDGRSNGLVAPNGAAQQAVVRSALAAAGISPDELDYVEAHGVGTPVADAVELHALSTVLGPRSAQEPLLVGSAKTNVGHLEAASGMVSLIKVALALQHEEIPPHLYLRDLHSNIELDARIAIPTTPQPWRRSPRPRFAGVNGFGFGGTNAHVILREAPLPAPVASTLDRPWDLLALSAKSADALRELAARYANRLATGRGEKLGDLCFSANVGRAHFAHRLALPATQPEALRERLARFSRGGSEPGVRSAQAGLGKRVALALAFVEPKVAPDAGLGFYQTHPQFRTAIEHCERLLQPHLERPLKAVLYDDTLEERAAWLMQPSYQHAALLALQYGLHGLFLAWGLGPSAVYGAGAGEYAAAAASGVLSWDRAIVLAARRGLVLEGLSPGASQRLTVRQLKEELLASELRAPSLPYVSASLGRAFALDEVPDAAHWKRHIYRAPRSTDHRDSREALLATGCHEILELGPRDERGLDEQGARASWLASLDDTGSNDWQVTLDTLALLYTRGFDVDWRAFDAPYPRRKLSLPSYPFQRQRYWLDFPERDLNSAEPNVIERPSSHPLISRIRIHAPARSGFVLRESDSGESSEGSVASGESNRRF